MSLIRALWNDPNAQTRVDLTLSGLTWVDLTNTPLKDTPIAVWNITGSHDLIAGDAIIIEGVTGTYASLLDGRFIISFAFNDGYNTQIRYVTTAAPPPAGPDSGATFKR